MRVNIDQLSNNAHVWIFGISPSLDEAGSRRLLEAVDGFLDDWAAHNVPITGAHETSFEQGVESKDRSDDLTIFHFGLSAGLGAWFDL